MNKDKIYKAAIQTFGKREQKLMAIEEMSELTKEICKDFAKEIIENVSLTKSLM